MNHRPGPESHVYWSVERCPDLGNNHLGFDSHAFAELDALLPSILDERSEENCDDWDGFEIRSY
jgi:hypothetical protein